MGLTALLCITTSPLSPRCEDPARVVASRTTVPPSQVKALEGVRALVEAKAETFVGVSVFDISNYRTWPCRTDLDGIYDYASGTLPYVMRVWKEGQQTPTNPGGGLNLLHLKPDMWGTGFQRIVCIPSRFSPSPKLSRSISSSHSVHETCTLNTSRS
jgi:hypothetical protein